MTPKEEAEALVWQYYNILEHTISDQYSKKDWEIAKQCAMIAVNRILEATKVEIDRPDFCGTIYNTDWQRIKIQLEKL